MPNVPEDREKSSLAESLAALTTVQHMRRRLVLCLDGTWNARDSGTNIYHLSNLIQEGIVHHEGGPWFQMVYYDPGVGTGVLDGITGGAFGIGLSENVRQAYDWLVEKYRDDDEVYIFGFSRGAFTARSLAGLISKCGLLQRGAPMPPSELWNAYRLLGRYPNPTTRSEPPKYWWERIRGQLKPSFRAISELKPDSWLPPGNAPLPKAAQEMNEAERLLCQWSRRIRITCLGVFDTVGSLGVDALAIPWLRERTAQFHDTQLSPIIQHGFQALGIDEHRANFHHIGWHRPVKSPPPNPDTIEQRWFAGAHSNVGGSYEDDLLSQYPLAWMMEKCAALGLTFRGAAPGTFPAQNQPPPVAECIPLLRPVKPEREDVADQCPHIRDSFAELAHGLWRGLIRNKRDYRTLLPSPEFQNSLLVQSVNEKVDDSVWALLALDNQKPLAPEPRYNPPNLWKLAQAKLPELPRPAHRYLEDRASVRWLAAWLFCVAFFGLAIAHAFPSRTLRWWIVVGTVAVAWLIDWTESCLNFATSLEPAGFRAERRKAFASLCLFLRLGVFCGIACAILYWLFQARHWLTAFDHSWNVMWLLGFNVIVLYCIAAAAWSAGPMQDAGFGSILPLQFRWTPASVLAQLQDWTTRTEATTNDNRLLLPVAHTLWRDMLGYIPAYTSLIFMGSWVALSVWGHTPFEVGLADESGPLLSRDVFPFKVVAGVAILCALGDYLEDVAHLTHLRRYPHEPSALVVALGALGTALKFVFLLAGGVGVAFAIGWLFFDQAHRVYLWFTFPRPNEAAGALSLLAMVLTILLLIPPLLDLALLKKRSAQNSK